MSTAARELFDLRHASGWGIDPIRTQAYLTSSQTLTLNVLGPMLSRPEWLIAVLNELRPGTPKVLAMDSAQIEYSVGMRPDGLGDRTIADAVISVSTESGPIVIVIETKLGDRFNSRAITLGDGYAAISHLWLSGSVTADSSTNQLARVHALGEWASTRLRPHAELILLRHQIDRKAEAIASMYRQELRDPDLLHDVSLDSLFTAMMVTAMTSEDQRLAAALDLRYGQLQPSEELWLEFLATFPHAGRKVSAAHDNE